MSGLGLCSLCRAQSRLCATQPTPTMKMQVKNILTGFFSVLAVDSLLVKSVSGVKLTFVSIFFGVPIVLNTLFPKSWYYYWIAGPLPWVLVSYLDTYSSAQLCHHNLPVCSSNGIEIHKRSCLTWVLLSYQPTFNC